MEREEKGREEEKEGTEAEYNGGSAKRSTPPHSA